MNAESKFRGFFYTCTVKSESVVDVTTGEIIPAQNVYEEDIYLSKEDAEEAYADCEGKRILEPDVVYKKSGDTSDTYVSLQTGKEYKWDEVNPTYAYHSRFDAERALGAIRGGTKLSLGTFQWSTDPAYVVDNQTGEMIPEVCVQDDKIIAFEPEDHIPSFLFRLNNKPGFVLDVATGEITSEREVCQCCIYQSKKAAQEAFHDYMSDSYTS